MKQPNAQYNIAQAGSLPVRIAGRMRRRMYKLFLESTGVKAGESILDVGVTSDQSYSSSNYLEAWYPNKSDITAVGLDDASFLEKVYPGVTFLFADGMNLPFPDDSFDYVHSSAVLEHVGNIGRQQAFVGELFRVTKKGLFMTTPNRWFPVEFHTVMPLVHWLPKPIFRWLMTKTGRVFFADEQNLNLLSSGEISQICRRLNIEKRKIIKLRLLGWTSNLVLVAMK